MKVSFRQQWAVNLPCSEMTARTADSLPSELKHLTQNGSAGLVQADVQERLARAAGACWPGESS